MEPVARLYRQLRASAPPMAGLLSSIVSGGLWTADRKRAAYGEAGPFRCPLCGSEAEDAHHAVWSCPALADSTVPEIASSQSLAVRAALAAPVAACFWHRALAPRAWIPQRPASSEPRAVLFQPPPPEGVLTHWCTDGAGGLAPPGPLAVCGWSVVRVDPMVDPFACVAARFGVLPGPSQTVPRAELYAVCEAAGACLGPLVVFTDHLNLLTRWEAYRERGAPWTSRILTCGIGFYCRQEIASPSNMFPATSSPSHSTWGRLLRVFVWQPGGGLFGGQGCQ